MSTQKQIEKPTQSMKRTAQPLAGWENEGGAPTHESANEQVSLQADPEKVRARAYEIFEARQRSGRAGDAAEDWTRAEAELSVALSPAPTTLGRAR